MVEALIVIREDHAQHEYHSGHSKQIFRVNKCVSSVAHRDQSVMKAKRKKDFCRAGDEEAIFTEFIAFGGR